MSDDDLVDTIMKSDLENLYRNTHKQMLEKHPDQKKIIDEMLEAKLSKIGVKP